MSVLAAIDCGTNSTRLLVSDEGHTVERLMRITRLGQGVDATGRLANIADVIPGNGDPVTVRSSGPDITDVSEPKDPRSPIRNLDDAPRGQLPRTGSAVPLGLTVVLAGAALGLLALRRRTVQ